MSESETGETSEKETKQEAPTRKRLRHRKKLLYEKIMHQMEFYFSDANLTKDRFLTQVIKEDPYVPLETFLKFNKIRSLTQDTNDIAKAMKHSTLLELSEDRLKVRKVIKIHKKPMLLIMYGDRSYTCLITSTSIIRPIQKLLRLTLAPKHQTWLFGACTQSLQTQIVSNKSLRALFLIIFVIEHKHQYSVIIYLA